MVQTGEDFTRSPHMVYYELTDACNQKGEHCHAGGRPNDHTDGLDTIQAESLFAQIATFPNRPALVLSGDPTKRPDICHLVRSAGEHGLTTVLSPSDKALITRDFLRQLKDAGLSRLMVRLDGLRETHDTVHGVPGSFERTLGIVAGARDIGLLLQVNTTITQNNFDQVDSLAAMISYFGTVLWSVFFSMSSTQDLAHERISIEQFEIVLKNLFAQARRQAYRITSPEAPHRRPVLRERNGDPIGHAAGEEPGQAPYARLGANSSKGLLFVGHTGNISPTGVLPIKCGSFPQDSVVDVYQKSPLFTF